MTPRYPFATGLNHHSSRCSPQRGIQLFEQFGWQQPDLPADALDRHRAHLLGLRHLRPVGAVASLPSEAVRSAPVTYLPSELFASAAPYYARYRPGYPQEVLDHLVARLGLDGRQRALDIGCGTGQLAIPLARHLAEVIAIDPQPDMLRLGREAARRAGVTNIDWRLGDSTRLAELGAGQPHLATFAASFHWTDRPAVVRELDGLLGPRGTIVVIANGEDDDEEADWVRAIAEIRARHLGPRRRAGSGTYDDPEHGHVEVLRASAFSAVDVTYWPWRRELTVEQVVGLQFSYSFSTPALFGGNARAFADEVRDAVLALHPSGTVVEPLRVELLIATRPRL